MSELSPREGVGPLKDKPYPFIYDPLDYTEIMAEIIALFVPNCLILSAYFADFLLSNTMLIFMCVYVYKYVHTFV